MVRIAVRLAALNGPTWECVIDQWILSLSSYIFLLDQSDCPLHKPAIKGYPARSSSSNYAIRRTASYSALLLIRSDLPREERRGICLGRQIPLFAT